MAKKIKLQNIEEFVVAWQRNKYQKTLVYQGRDGKLYPIVGRVRPNTVDRTKVDIPFFFSPEKKFTVSYDAIKTGIVKSFKMDDGRECSIVIAEVSDDISPETFRKVVEDNILDYLNRRG